MPETRAPNASATSASCCWCFFSMPCCRSEVPPALAPPVVADEPKTSLFDPWPVVACILCNSERLEVDLAVVAAIWPDMTDRTRKLQFFWKKAMERFCTADGSTVSIYNAHVKHWRDQKGRTCTADGSTERKFRVQHKTHSASRISLCGMTVKVLVRESRSLEVIPVPREATGF